MSALSHPRVARLVLALCVALVAAGVRIAYQVRIAPTESSAAASGWHTFDGDSLYHVRRVARAIDEGGVAARDGRLGWPEFRAAGAPIPWPPVYDAALAQVARPFVPDGDGSRAFVLRLVCSAPVLFGALAAAAAAWATARLAGLGAGLAAGLLLAFSFASVRYSHWGMGDHHAAVSALLVLLAAGLGRALEPAQLKSVAGSLRRGLLLGALAAALLGTWVASLPQVLALSTWTVARVVCGRAQRSGLVALGLGLHLAPAVLLGLLARSSPWPADELVALSWLHALVFLPGALALAAAGLAGPAALARWGAALVFGAGAAGIGAWAGWGAEGLAWAGGGTTFMGSIAESQPLDGAAGWSKWLGYGIWLLPLAWLAALAGVVRGRAALAPWVLLAIPAVPLALAQRRFAEGLAPVAAVLLAWAAAAALQRALPLGTRRRLAPVLLTLLALGAQAGTVAGSIRAAGNGLAPPETPELERRRGLIELLERCRPLWPGAMLAQWDLGHVIEWYAARPSVATGFGSYLSRSLFLAPWRVFAAENLAEAERQLEALDVELVLVTSHYTSYLGAQARALGLPEEWLAGGWKQGLGARLAGYAGAPGQGVGFLRQVLVAAPEFRDRTDFAAATGLDLPPTGRVYQRVRGARVQREVGPGQRLEVSCRVHFPGEALLWRSAATAVGPDGEPVAGTATVVVPYASDLPAGDGRLEGAIRWRVVGTDGVLDQGELQVPEAAIRAGDSVRIQ